MLGKKFEAPELRRIGSANTGFRGAVPPVFRSISWLPGSPAMGMVYRLLLPTLVLALLLLAVAIVPSQASPSNDPSLRNYAPGSIIIKTKMRQLIYVRGKNDFVTYKIAVGREGRKWTGKTKISRKVLDPAWAPPAAVRRDNPKLPAVVQPGPHNPLGVAVLVLGSGRYGIHGTNRPETIGTDASYGCFRMYNADILGLFDQVEIGTVVYVQR